MATMRRTATATVAAATLGAAIMVAMPATASAATARAAAPTLVVPQAAAPASVGRLVPSGCTGTGTVTCDLYARTGSTSMPGALSDIPIWGFAADATTPVTAPGPVLVVHQNDQVTITVHNNLADPVALALPGQQNVNGGVGDDRVGAPTAGTKAYTFTAGRPGTFLYEAGHTADGARQVAMGMAGALIVLPSVAGSGYGNPTGFPSTNYDDDAVLVLSEIDPRLNANPLTFDMRNFKPSYRLINGHPFPSATSTIPTDQGHTVLVRYVNAGVETHAMSVLGGSQVEVAQDGHPTRYSTTVTAESIASGQTLDTLVSMPTSNGDPRIASKVAIFEANGALDNAGALTADDPPQVGFGGMLTFLDTNAPVTSPDVVGPTAKALALSQNPSDARSDVTISATISDTATGGAAIAAAEYIIDDNAAAPIAASNGNAMTLTGTGPSTASASGTIPASLLGSAAFPAGKHIIYVRGEDANSNWGVVGSIVFNVPKTGPATTNGSLTPSITNGSEPIDISATGDDSLAGGTVTAAEYFLDHQPTTADYGTGTTMAVNRAAAVVSVDATLDPTAPGAPTLSEGIHHVYVHVKDNLGAAGLWGPPLDLPLTVDRTGPTTLAAAFNPPATNTVQGDPSNPGYVQVTAEVADQGALPNKLVNAEAFFNTIKANGSGLQLLPVDGKIDSLDEHFYALVPMSQIKAFKDGKVTVFVHGQDAAGNWGDATVNSGTLVVDRVAPKLTGLSGSLAPAGTGAVALTSALVEANTLGAAEVWTTAKDPGVGKATPATFNQATGSVTVQGNLLATGSRVTYNIRVRDLAGNWSNAVQTTVVVSRSYLESAPTDWSGTAGSAGGISAGAALSNPDEPSTTKGWLDGVATTPTASRTGFLYDNTPVAATALHARFRMAATTLSTAASVTNAVTLFDARTVNGSNRGASVVALQYRTSGGIGQVRATVGAGTAQVAGAWVSIGTTAHTISLDWVGGAAGTLVLTVDTTQVTVTGPGTAKIEALELGVSSALVNGATGAAGAVGFDTFLAVTS